MRKARQVTGALIGAVGLVLVFLRAAFAAFGDVGSFLKILPTPVSQFIGTPDGTLFLLLFGVGVIWWAVRHPVKEEAVGLSTTQRAAIREVLSRYQRPASLDRDDQYRYLIIFPIPGNPAAALLAANFRDLFGQADFDPQLISNELPGERDVSRFSHGIWLRGGDPYIDYDPPTVEIVKEALQAAAIDYRFSPDNVADVELIIGNPPSTPSDDAVAALLTTNYENTVARLNNRIHELEDANRRRRLDEDQMTAITTTVRAGLEELRNSLIAASWEPEDIERRLVVQLVSIGTDRETLNYRGDFATAFEAGGFDVLLSEQQAGGGPQHEEFVDVVTVLRGNPANVVRPFILDALRAARLTPHEADYLPPGGMLFTHGQPDPMQSTAATLVIGQRR